MRFDPTMATGRNITPKTFKHGIFRILHDPRKRTKRTPHQSFKTRLPSIPFPRIPQWGYRPAATRSPFSVDRIFRIPLAPEIDVSHSRKMDTDSLRSPYTLY